METSTNTSTETRSDTDATDATAPTVLLTGYEPFGDFETNPARQLAARLDGTDLGTHTVVGRELPVVFDQAADVLESAIDEHDPDIVCALGLAGGRNTLSLERVGINLRDTSASGIPDNDDREPVDECVVADGPDAYFTTLPVRAMKAAMQDAGVPTTLSTDAGTHCCNNLLYAARHLVETEASTVDDCDVGFVHVPFSHVQAAARDEGEPSMALETMQEGLLVGLEAACSR
ncbi:pyrrolidone-carboxylate peptidase [Natrialba magadii ATCC 43099]|uniref:Pyroglutamyl-peptidase I n=1 Tax=Natrialba magadii (strain ATCC 43099 / DSM 3394 / CCM 3739 / CIP 104546 / IAM 13178 / JCM 8861 / NBRC 102185 / NCIMB 2190 / MS3) TaxID=547559 RepID=D3SSC8_NATMM|nr:pyroglutamyl-peptidase I [Natrialba magadii]ADD04854.1 pyrrolidone-carboxylate peptidase [Natrialba magadii ATCC 43099]ELY24439.1 pyrrolidone-carboxylate peptidase [Natrialba magadii ATCC 43099]